MKKVFILSFLLFIIMSLVVSASWSDWLSGRISFGPKKVTPQAQETLPSCVFVGERMPGVPRNFRFKDGTKAGEICKSFKGKTGEYIPTARIERFVLRSYASQNGTCTGQMSPDTQTTFYSLTVDPNLDPVNTFPIFADVTSPTEKGKCLKNPYIPAADIRQDTYSTGVVCCAPNA